MRSQSDVHSASPTPSNASLMIDRRLSPALLGSACKGRLLGSAPSWWTEDTDVAFLDVFASSCLAGDTTTMAALVSCRGRIDPVDITMRDDYLGPLCRRVATDDKRGDVLRVLDGAGLGASGKRQRHFPRIAADKREAAGTQRTIFQVLREVCRRPMPCTIAALLGPRLFDAAMWEQSRSTAADELMTSAASSGDPAVLQLLSGPPLSLANGSVSESPLRAAVCHGDVQCLRVLTSPPYMAGAPSSDTMFQVLCSALGCLRVDRDCLDYIVHFGGWNITRPDSDVHGLLFQALT
eukprot:m51a1_g3114 hypothetical protein (294) ;mRNA; r:161229-166448